MKKIFISLLILSSSLGFAQTGENEKTTWKHESEVAVVKVGGNTESESYSGKQKTSYSFDMNILTAAGRYLQSKAGNVETARSWDASLRYERVITDTWSAFLQHGAESDPYAGYVQRDNSDIGGKYFFIKSDAENLFSELGYRYTTTTPIGNAERFSESFGRFYAEYARQITATLSGKLWVEYLPNFKNSDAYLVNYEPSVNAMISSVFSLKVAYLVKYHNKTLTASEKKEDTTFTTALVAKF